MLVVKIALIVAVVRLALWFCEKNDKNKGDTTGGGWSDAT